MRRIVLLVWMAGIASACRTDIVCCPDDAGTPVLSQRGMCADHGFGVVPDSICDGITDVDLNLDDNDTDAADPVDEKLERCQTFCGFIAAQADCESLESCMESCDHSVCAPTDEAINCVETAPDCASADGAECWNDWLDVPPEGDTDEPTCPA